MQDIRIVQLPLDRIIAKEQVRKHFSEEAHVELMATLDGNGVMQPIHVRRHEDDLFIIIDGERRFRATKAAGHTTIPAIIKDRTLAPGETGMMQLILNKHEPLTALEQADAIEAAISESGLTASEIGKKLGLTKATVSKHRALSGLPGFIREHVANGRVSAAAAYELSQVTDREQQAQITERLVSGQLTRDGIRNVRKTRGKATVEGDKKSARVTAVLGAGRTVSIAGPCLTLETVIECLEELLAKARRARPQGLSITTFVRLLKEQANAGGR